MLSHVKSFNQEGIISRPYQITFKLIKQNLYCRLKAISSSAGSNTFAQETDVGRRASQLFVSEWPIITKHWPRLSEKERICCGHAEIFYWVSLKSRCYGVWGFFPLGFMLQVEGVTSSYSNIFSSKKKERLIWLVGLREWKVPVSAPFSFLFGDLTPFRELTFHYAPLWNPQERPRQLLPSWPIGELNLIWESYWGIHCCCTHKLCPPSPTNPIAETRVIFLFPPFCLLYLSTFHCFQTQGFWEGYYFWPPPTPTSRSEEEEPESKLLRIQLKVNLFYKKTLILLLGIQGPLWSETNISLHVT